MTQTCPKCGTQLESKDVGSLCPSCLAGRVTHPIEDPSGSTRPTPGDDPGRSRGPSDQPTEAGHDPSPLEPGAVFRGMEVTQLLGRGGMGFVYKARQPDLDRFVALKLLSPRLAQDPEFAHRFNREAKTLASLDHRNIVRLIEYGKEDGLFFLSMEYVDGLSLRQLMRQRPLTAPEALKIILQVCDALEYAHAEGLVHRDVKPDNILLDRKGRVKIADFGLAKMRSAQSGATQLTRTDVVMGTPDYMAPEQRQDTKGVDHRADIYSLGVVSYELLTGELPVGRFEPPSHRVEVDPRLDDVILKALEKRPERRYQKVQVLRDEVTEITRHPTAAVVVVPDQESPGLQEAAESLREFLAGRTTTAHPRGSLRRFSLMTGLLFSTAAVSVAGVFLWRRNADVVNVLSHLVIASAVFFVWFFIRDCLAGSARTRETPEQAVRSFFRSVKWGFWKHAYACVSPLDRRLPARETPDLSPLTVRPRRYSFESLAGLRDYWKAVAGTPARVERDESVKWIGWKVENVESVSDRLGRVRVTLRITGIPRWLRAAQLLVIILAAIITPALVGAGIVAAILFAYLFRKSKYLSVTKLLYRHEARWYFMNGELEGLIDRIAVKEAPPSVKEET